jgi:hypothetical protein
MKGIRFRGLLILGALVAVLAVAWPVAAQDADSAHQPRAQEAIAKAQAARDAISKAQVEAKAPAPSARQQHLLDKATVEMQRATEYYESGRYRDAARTAQHVSELLARASGPERHEHPKEVQ